MRHQRTRGRLAWLGAAGLVACLDARGSTQSRPIGSAPVEHVYAVADGVKLRAFAFSPVAKAPEGRAAIALFHGGGWVAGEPGWAFARARHFSELGLVAVSVEYRLSDQKAITPLEAMSDARAAIRWMRKEAGTLGIDPGRIAAYGWSAGAHLAASAAIFEGAESAAPFSSAPDALILVSPAVALESDSWAKRLLGKRAAVREISPDEHVRKGLPPTLILQGDVDTVTPLAGVQRFCERLRAADVRCDLQIYKGFGHLFTPAGIPDDGEPKPDPKTQADALARADRFLGSLGFTK